MIGQEDMFGHDTAKAHARRCDPDTSHEAAKVITPSLRPLQVSVLGYAYQHGTFTDVALNEHFDSHRSTFRTRRAELVAMGFVEDAGERVKVAGGTHALWRITASGRAEYARLLLGSLDQAA